MKEQLWRLFGPLKSIEVSTAAKKINNDDNGTAALCQNSLTTFFFHMTFD